MRTASQCLKMLSNRKHSVWLQKLSETTYSGDITAFKGTGKSHLPSKLWRGRIYKGGWHYGTYTEVLNTLVENALAKETR